MVNIKIYNIVIKLDFLFLNDFISLNKYITKDDNQYIIKSYPNMDFVMPRKSPDAITKFYDFYQFDDHIIQIQKDNDTILGAIIYTNNEISLFMKNPSFQLEYLLSQYAIAYIINKHNAIIMHGSSLKYKNKGIIFTAKSGTGKSTHSRLWQKYSDALVINDDKNIIAIENDKLVLYPSCWSGKHMLDNNITSTLDCIVFLYQSPTNIVNKISKVEAMKRIIGQVQLPTINNKETWNKIIDKLLELPIYLYGCNMEYEAFETICKELERTLCL